MNGFNTRHQHQDNVNFDASADTNAQCKRDLTKNIYIGLGQ